MASRRKSSTPAKPRKPAASTIPATTPRPPRDTVAGSAQSADGLPAHAPAGGEEREQQAELA